MDELFDSGFTSCPCDLLRDGDEDVFELIVALKRGKKTACLIEI